MDRCPRLLLCPSDISYRAAAGAKILMRVRPLLEARFVSCLIGGGALTLLLVLSVVDVTSWGTTTPEQDSLLEVRETRDEQPKPVFIIILCKGLGRILKEDVVRQLRQTNVLLKSAVTFTDTTIRFLVVTDTVTLYDQVVSLTEGWPVQYRKQLVLEHHNVWYPPDREELRPLARPCSSARVFLTHVFPNLDAAVLLDTDTIFLRPPGQLWQHLRQFDDVQAVGMALAAGKYKEAKMEKFPHYGDGGVNTGVMVMNFTRLRNLPGGGYTKAFLTAYDKYKDVLSEAYTNDLINIVFSQEHQHLVYELEYEWNYTPGGCNARYNYYPQTARRGISLLHATGASFLRGTNSKFQAMFEAWERYQLGTPLARLLQTLEVLLKRQNGKDGCRFVPEMDDLLTKALKERING